MTGSIQVRTLKGGTKRYHAVWRAGGKQKRKAFSRKKDATRFLADTVKKVHDGTYVETRPAMMREVFAAWLSDLDTRVILGEIKPSTSSTYRGNVNKHFVPALGDYRSDQLTARIINKWRRELAERIGAGDMARKSYNNLHNLLHSILSWAREPAQGFMSHDPLLGQKRLKITRREAEFLEDDDMKALLKAVREDAEANSVVQLGLLAGLRRGEIFGLQWNDIESFNGGRGGRLRVRRSIYKGNLTAPKTAAGERIVDVPQRVLDTLKRQQEKCPAIGTGFVLRTRTGAPIDPNSWYRRRFAQIRYDAELSPSIGLHSLRHTYASLLIRNGENPKYVSRQMGHSSVAFTMDTYGHLFEATSTEAMKRLDAVVPTGRPELRIVGGQDA